MRSLFTFLVMGLLSFLGITSAQALEVGESAPMLPATDQDGKPLVLGDVYKKGTTLVYFFLKADTPGCTAQACSLRDSNADLLAKGVQVVGVSGDKPEAQKMFQDKYQLPFPLIADADGAVAKGFGVPAAGEIAKRQAFLVKNGKIVWRDLNASTKNQAADVLKAVEQVKVK